MASYDSKDCISNIIFVVIGYAQAIVWVVVVGTDFYALFIPFYRLIVISELTIDAAQTIVRMLIFLINFNGFHVRFYSVVVLLDVQVSVSKTIVASCIVGFGLYEFLEQFDSLFYIFMAKGYN